MRYWLIFTGLIIVNLVVWAIFSDVLDDKTDEIVDIDAVVNTNISNVENLPFEVVQPEKIKLLSDKVFDGDGCMIAGPFSEDITASEIKRKLFDENKLGFRKIVEPSQRLLAYRVYIGPVNEKQLAEIELKLIDVSVNDYYIYDYENKDVKQNDSSATDVADDNVDVEADVANSTSAVKNSNGKKIISLGVYGYKQSADNFSYQLNKTGFKSKIETEAVTMADRYWLSVGFDQLIGDINIEDIKLFIKDEAEKLTKTSNIMVDIAPKCPI